MEPRHPGNVGAIARVMQNFGFSDLVLVDALCSPLDPESLRRAKHARLILENARRIKLSELKESFHTLVATTAQIGSVYNLPRVSLTPEQLALQSATFSDSTESLGIVFGRESEGLSNEEIALCDLTVSIPCPLENPVLNLSHAVCVILYELSKQQHTEKTTDHLEPVSAADLLQMKKMINELINRFDYAKPDQDETQKLVWNRLFSKSFLSKREAYVVMGLLRKLIDKN